MKKVIKIYAREGQIYVDDGYSEFKLPEKYHDHVKENETWLVDYKNNSDIDWLVQLKQPEIVVYEKDGHFYKYAWKESPVLSGPASLAPDPASGQSKEHTQDIQQIKELFDQIYDLGSTLHVLASGQTVQIENKIVGNSLVKTCENHGLVQVMPLTAEVIKEVIEVNGKVSYDHHNHCIDINGVKINVQMQNLPQIFPDITIKTKCLPDGSIYGEMVSSKIKESDTFYLGRQEYQIAESGYKLVHIEPEWVVDPNLNQCLYHKVPPMSYDTFKQCMAHFIAKYGRTMPPEELQQCLTHEYTNFDGTPINLSVYDCVELQAYIPSLELDIERYVKSH